MSDKPLAVESGPKDETPQEGEREATLTVTVAAAVSPEDKERIVTALENSGWGQSRGIRLVLLAFVESAKVRDAVFDYVRRRVAA